MFKIVKFLPLFIDEVLRIENLSFETPWTKEQILSSAHNKNTIFDIVLVNNVVIGYCLSLITYKEIEILRIAIDTDFRHKSYATALIRSIVNYSIANNIENIFLEVAFNNQAAINLYKSFNFETISIREKYYKEENALVLRKQIKCV
jgi:ribosomal-protein-alanine N-acetyltransferase